jgi:hypothetical protein
MYDFSLLTFLSVRVSSAAGSGTLVAVASNRSYAMQLFHFFDRTAKTGIAPRENAPRGARASRTRAGFPPISTIHKFNRS